MKLTGAQILIEALLAQGTDVVFGYPGGAVLNIYDALYERREAIRHILTSHEQGASHAADGYARSTGKVGVVIATSGPGATNLVTGIATAYHDSVPLVAITGNVPQALLGRDSFQEVDIVSITKTVVKKNFFVTSPADLPGIVREAFEIAASGRKGPVLIDIPKDVTAMKTEYIPQPHYQYQTGPEIDPASLAEAAQAIAASERPLIYCGGGVTFSDSSEALLAFAKKIQAPVCTSMMGLSSIPTDSELNLGLVGMHGTATANMAVSKCDLLLAIGARFSDRVAGDRKNFARNARIIHLDIDKKEINKNVEAQLWVLGHVGETLARLTDLVPEVTHPEWMHTIFRHKAYNGLPFAKSEGKNVNPREVITALRPFLGEEGILVTDVGQHQMLAAQYYPFVKPRTFLSSSGLGTMGYGMGAANGAAVGNPNRRVALVTGDGSFHMNMAELAVAVSHQLPLVVVIMNNGVLGMVHQWQNLFYGGRYSQTEIGRKTDFVAFAESFGAKGLRIEDASQIRPVLEEAFAWGQGPCVVDCRIPSAERVFPIIPAGGTEDDMIYAED
ncbi:biosynthetic-type acetolactate synthase large subunit [Oscillospiraceae bacterium MB08-C2-2]|nr:biosynthetic-type acetolactate synthase large subunit [Oscillospiraceae bacterium MB08-C2-2]